MKEASYAEELKILANFKETRNEWFVKEEKKTRSGKATPKVQAEEGSSSQPKKRQKKVVVTMLVDESEKEDEAEAEGDAKGDQVRLSPESAKFLKSLNEYNAETEKAVGEEGDDVEKSLSSSSEEEIDESERAERIRAEVEKEKQLKRKRREDKDDELYSPSPEHVLESQTPPSSGGRKKASARKRVVSHKAARRKLIVKLPKRTSKSKPPTPPKQPTPPLMRASFKDFPQIPVNIPLDDIGDFSFVNDEQVKKLEKKIEEVLVENKKLVDREKKLEKRVKTVEAENSSLLQRVESDQAEIDILKVRITELEEEKARRDEQNKYFKLKNKELEAPNAKKEHEMYMINKVLENLLGKSVEQKFEEIEVEEVRARRQAAIDAEMKNKGKGVEGTSEVTERAIVPSSVSESPVKNPRPISAVSDDVFSASSHSDDDNDDDGQGGTGIKVTEVSNEENIDDSLRDDANEEPDAEGEGENVDYKNVDDSERLILRLKPDIKEGEIRHTYTMDDIIKMTHIDESTFKFDFEEELNAFDINQQPDYQYKYVEEADNYDRAEVEDCSDEESVNVDTSNFPTLVEFFSQVNIDELRRKVEECLKNKNFDGTTKDESHEERKKWFRKSTEIKFKRPLKFYKRDREISLGDIISWGFLPQVNVYAIRREYGVQHFEYIQDIMSLPWWDVEELSKVRTLNYPIRKHDVPIWGLMKYEAFR
ncbi:WEB family protein At4g27595, chloroplastic-like [Helianthus annuus]|uniref:WEB family protein At4g27595, chloroplastic-like n=1 Tax=Helianthus annuus TaxID=4232 RepID=UPI000B8FAB9F|nr:WEB family protein At4g27595, chloroplastic-like [Helianthus annuus]